MIVQTSVPLPLVEHICCPHCWHLECSLTEHFLHWFHVVTHNLEIFIRLLDNASRWGWIIDGLVRMSGTGQAFNSLSCWVSYPVTKGHRTNTQRNDVLEGGKEKRRQGAENKIKEACILYATVGLSHSTREIWQQRKALHRLKPFLCFFLFFWSIEKWCGGRVFFVCKDTHRSLPFAISFLFCRNTCFKFSTCVNTGCDVRREKRTNKVCNPGKAAETSWLID